MKTNKLILVINKLIDLIIFIIKGIINFGKWCYHNKNVRLDIIFVVVMLLYMICTIGNKAEATIQASEQYLNMEFNLDPPIEYNWELPFDIDRLARAVAKHETGSCTLGYGKMYNNCYGIKNGNTAPCKKIGRNRMCIYDNPEESTEAFKKIWSKWYGGMPTLEMARRWSGNDNAYNWLNNVKLFYNKN